MAATILNIPFRKSHDLQLSNAIKQYISVKYDQHPDQFDTDLKTIDALRTDAIHIQEPHASGVRKLAGYAAQLGFMGGKFPIDIGADFTWYPALGFNTQTPTSQNNLKFELANILFNLAALYSQIATSVPRNTADGIKQAYNNFTLAAGTIQYIDKDIIPEMRSTPPEDMDHMTLHCLQNLMVAQAQECFWEKAKMDGFKDSSISRLAAQVSDLYIDAAESGMKSDAISSEWIHHMTAKHHHFAAAAQYRAACDCLERRKYGEEIARLQDALEAAKEALKESRWINKMVLADLQDLKQRVQETLKRAEKDNDLIYLNPVPAKSQLTKLLRTSMATPVIPKEISQASTMMGENLPFGRPLFAKLVPFAVHTATDIYSERKDRLVNSTIIAELETLTTGLHDVLTALNLPGSLQALEKPLGLPRGIITHAEEIRQQDGVNRINRSQEDVSNLRKNCIAMFDDAAALLKAEAVEDNAARARYGTERWTRPESSVAASSLKKQEKTFYQHIISARGTDSTIYSKIVENTPILKLLAGPDSGLSEFIPNSRQQKMAPEVEKQVSNLRSCLNEVNRLEERRWRRVGALRDKANSDDIGQAILIETNRLEKDFPMMKIEPRMFEPFFAERLKRYDDDKKLVSTEQNEQDDLVTRLTEANDRFNSARRGDIDGASKQRQHALQTLENGYFKYKDVISKLDLGRNFYNDLGPLLSKFRESCKVFVAERRAEAARLETDITSPMSALNLSSTSTALQEQQHNNSMNPMFSMPSSGQSQAQQQAPMAAPMPTRSSVVPPGVNPALWTPDMGIKFGGAASKPPQPASSSSGSSDLSSNQKPSGGGQWDPSRGLRFS